MKNLVILFCAIGILSGVQVASATVVHFDFVVVQNPTAAVFGDLFDGAALDTNLWFPTGSPGPQAGGLLEMHGGDSIAASLALNSQAGVVAQALVNLTSFDADSAVALTFGAGADSVGMVVTPTFSFVGNGGGLLGLEALNPGASALLTLAVDPDGNIAATVNDITIYTGPGAGPLTIDSLTLQALPEPSTALAGLLVAGIFGLRRSRSAA